MTRSEPAVATPPEVSLIDDLDHGKRRRHTVLWLGGLGVLLVVTLPVAVGLGPVGIAPGTVTQIVTYHLFGWPETASWSGAEDSIVWLVRMPRVVLGTVVGAGLALTGVALQAMVRNVLADPYILGVTSGASTGAAATILFGVGAAVGASSLTASAFVGALAATAALYLLARVGGQITSIRLLLAGVTIGYVLSAATSFLIFASDTPEGARAVLFWLLGSLSLARWSSVGIAVLVVGASLVALMLWGRRFDALAISDDTARTLGVPPTRFRIQALAVVSLCVGAVVAVSGGIGFVGLVVPHVARLCVGGAHRRVYPVAALIGAAFLVWADVFARIAFAPRELPLGIVTAVVGAPLLIILVRRFHPMSG
ncbi:MAG: FecCD family ABC transporter permease [Pseudonocardiaceae bacterium]